MQIQLADEAMIRRLLPPRSQNTHKGHYGRALLVCGAVGYTGAAYFAAQSAVCSGAGLVDLTVPSPIYEIAAVKLNEAMVFPLPATPEGTVSEQAIPAIRKRMSAATAVLAGCGLGRSTDVEQVVLTLVTEANQPVVLDADGINAMCSHKDAMRAAKADLVLTPHDGELTRLLGEPPVHPGESRPEAAVRLAAALNVTLVMKGHQTVTAAPDGRVCLNSTGKAGMARGGSGDVLAGMITALLAQGLNPFEASAAAVYLHGLAGDLARKKLGETGMTPTDMLQLIPQAFYQCRGV